MSKFNHYAARANEIAKKALGELANAERKLKEAESQSKAHPVRTSGHVDPEEMAIAARAHADVLAAQEDLKRTRAKMDDTKRQLEVIRTELSQALADEYSAKPGQVDAATMTLLESGILTSAEYARLMDSAKKSGNTTMQRIIGRFAAREAEKFSISDERGAKLRAVAVAADDDIVSSKLDLYSVLTEVFDRCVNNIYMIDSWSELTGRATAAI